MKHCLTMMALACCLTGLGTAWAGHPTLDVNEDWRMSVQAYSFNHFTFEEAVSKAASIGLGYIEAFPGQKLFKNDPELKFDHGMTAETQQKVKSLLANAGLKVVNYGVVGLSNDEAACRQVFDFARAMGIETIVSEPPAEAMDLVDRLAQEYNINVAIHNHPKPAPYWNPDTVLAACKGRSRRIGSCADTGHWMRSGVDPVEAIKKLSGRIISLHFKDLNEAAPDAHDVPWGTGKANMPAIFDELARQNFKGAFSAEYEYNWDNSVPEIAQCAKFFDAQAARCGRPCWRWLFDGQDLAGWQAQEGGWAVEEGGVLTAKGNGDIWTADKYGDYVLELEFKLEKDTNSGVFLRAGDIVNWLNTSIEVQVLDSHGNEQIPPRERCGSIFDCLAAKADAVKPAGEWNKYVIVCRGNKINVALNGTPVIDMDLNQWTEAHKNPDGTPNKFETAYKDMPRSGFIGLQYHGHPVSYRNIKIKQLGENI